jgi:hypothetical protein
MRLAAISGLVLAGLIGAASAHAACVTKGAVATSADAKAAKWYAMETMVQSVSWTLWPEFVATSKVAGYKVSGERYKCKPDGIGVTCQARATFCPAGG